MNKIYKVIWSKVKNQYVVVSELAHSSGKQSRTAKRSLRSRIAALVVCGAIAAFGVYGALPVQQAFAAETADWQYAAIAVDPEHPDDKSGFGEYADQYSKVNVEGKDYWVRDGYHIVIEPQHRYDTVDKDNAGAPMPSTDDVIKVYRDEDWTEANGEGLLSSLQVVNSNMGITTLNGKDLQNVAANTYIGASSGGGSEADSSWNYIINDNGTWVDAGNDRFTDYFREVSYNAENGQYMYGEEIVDPQNVYFIDGKSGIFVTKDKDGNDVIYKGAVYGAHNEILVTGKGEEGYYSYWGAERIDPRETIGDKLTVGQYNGTIEWLNNNIEDIHEDDIKEIQVAPSTEEDKNGGTIGLQTNGEFKAVDQNNDGTINEDDFVNGKLVYEPVGGEYIPGGITITSEKENGEDTKIKFANDNGSFTVDAGSRVQGINNDEVVQGSNGTTTTIDGLEINGQKYSFDSKTYTDGDGIKFEGTDDGTISVDLATNDEKENISGLHFKNGQLANNLSIEEATPVEGETHSNKGNWSIIEDTGDGTTKTFTNTTLNTSASAEWNTGTDSLITGATIAEDNKVENPAEVADAKIEYGKNYKVIDTDGNIVELDDVASASKLRDVANNANDAQTEAKKHTIVSTKDENLGVENVGANGAAANYEISLKDKVVLGEGQGAIILNGQNKDEALLNVGNKLVIDQDGTTTIIADDGINNRPGQTQITPDTTVTISPDGVTFAGDDRGTTIIEGQKITAGGIVINGEDIYDETLGTTVKGTIKGLSNTTWNGTTTTPDRAATEGQLQTVSDKADEAVTEAGKHTIVSTKDENLGVENVGANGAAANYEISLKDKVVLGEGQGAIILNGQNKDEALLNVGNKLVIDQDGTTTIVANDGIDNRPGQTQITPDTTVTIAPSGVTFTGDDKGTTIIEGQKITAGGIVINGEDVYDKTTGIVTKGTITGLSNTTWDGTTDNESRVATEGQLEDLSDTVNTGWYVADKNTAEDSTTGNFAVKPGETLTFNGDDNIDVEAKDHEVNVSLNDNITLGEGNSQININGNPENGEAALSIGDKFVVEQNGTTTIVANDGIDNRPGQTQITPDTTVTIAPSGVTFTGDDKGTTIIEGQKITAGGIVINGEDVYDKTTGIVTKGTITGLSNTTWDGTTDNESRVATEGQLEDLSDTVNTGWYVADKNTAEDSTTGNFAVKPGETLTFNGDDNIDVEAKDHEVNVSLNDNITLGEGNSQININGNPENGEAALSIGDKFVVEQNGTTTIVANDGIDNRPGQTQITPDTTVTIAPSGVTFTGDDKGTTIIEGQKITAGGIVINGEDVYDKTTGIVTKGTITGLSNTTWDGKTDNASRVATEGQLEDLSDTVNTGWIATDGTTEVNVNPANNTLKFAGDNNITVTADSENNAINVKLNPVVTLDGNESDNNKVVLDGNNGTINATNTVKYGKGQGPGRTITNEFTFDNKGATFTSTTEKGHHDPVESSTNINGGTITTDTVKGLDNTTWNENIAKAVAEDKELQGVAATQGQLQTVDSKVNAGWIATDSQNHEVKITPDNNKLNFAGDENVTVTAANNEIKVALKDDIVLGDYLNGDDGVLIGGSSGTISATNSITVGEDQGLIIDGQKKEIQGLSNTTWNEKIANDAAVEGSTAASTAATQGQLQEVSKVANAGWTASDGTNSISVKPNETLTFVGDENLTVSADGTDKELKVSLNDDITLKGDSSSIELTGTKGTIQVNQETAEGTNFTNINGNVVSIGYTNSEGIENAIVIDGGKGTITGLSNTTWDDELATQVANSEELQGTAATQGQLQQAVSEVAEVANAGWNAKAGGNTINVKPNETLNFEGDGNITVSATGGTSNELKFGLNDDITLGNPKAGNTEGERSFTINTTAPEGYVPDSYKEENSSGAEFIKENGGFMLFATDTQGHGIFGVTAKGSAWAKDFKTYTTDIYGNNTQYSLNDVGDAVAQMSSYYNKENGKSYTVFSRYLNEAEKDNPFATVDENATRDIPLALRDDGAVVVGATIKGDDFTDNGIRINAETETTYDGDGNEVTNNIATITGLENTEWKPPTPVATFAANDINTTSRAATEAQLDDLYSAVAAYDVNVDGTIDYSHIALAGAPYGASRAGNGTPTGGTSITNVAYASGKDGSEAVNVDYLNNAIKDAVKDGPVASNEKHLDTSKTYTPDKTTGTITINEVDGTGAVTGNQLVINDVASKAELDSLKTGVGDRNYNNVTDTTPIANGDSVTTAIGKLNNSIKGVTQDVINNSISGGHVDETGKVVLEKGEGENKSEVTTDIQLTDSEVSGVTLEKDTETGKNVLTITSTDKYDKNKTSSVTVSGLEIASTDDIKDVTGVASSEDLKDAYKDADKDGNATTEYITDSESMVEADVALDHAIQDVAGTSYANDMVLSNRIDSVEKRLGNVEERIDKVGAMAAAIANLRTMGFDPEAPTEIAIGVGQYKSETGIAIGVFHYPNQDFMLSASLSSSGDELMGGIGATWKLGRKSAAERAKDEEARHLEQAEEMKKLAQQEKVKAQAQRHAKLLAERQQASQKNA